MSKRNYGKVDINEEAAHALSEYFADTDYSGYFDFGGVDLVSYSRLLSGVAAMGGTVSIYSRFPDPGVKLFIRIGQRSKSHPFDNEDQWNDQIEMICEPWLAAFGKYLTLKAPPKPISIAPVKGSKAKE